MTMSSRSAFALIAAFVTLAACGGGPGHGQLVWVGIEGGGLATFDTGSNEVTEKFTVANSPHLLAVTTVAAWFVEKGEDSLYRFDTQIKEEQSIALPAGTQPSGLALGGASIWVIGAAGKLVRVSTEKRTITSTLDLPAANTTATTDIRQVAAGSGGVWVTSVFGESPLTRVDSAGTKIVAAIPLGDGANGVAAGEGAVFVAGRTDASVFRVDPGSNKVTHSIKLNIFLPAQPGNIGVGHGRVWVLDVNGKKIRALDPKTLAEKPALELTSAPRSFTVNSDAVWVVTTSPSRVLRVDANARVAAEVPIEGAMIVGAR